MNFLIFELLTMKNRTFDQPLQTKTVTSKLAEKYITTDSFESKPEVTIHERSDPNGKVENTVENVSYHTISISNCFRKQREVEKRKRKSASCSKSSLTTFNKKFNAFQNQNCPNERSVI